MVNTLLINRYRLDDQLGQGGMGVVYCAHDTFLDRRVAVKVLSSGTLGTEGRVRLLHEARATAQLNHPNIVAVYDAGEADGEPFIVMEYVEGETLYDHRPGSIQETLSVIQQVCAALEHAHEHGIIHRDLKPENVMILPDGTVKLMDFGLARSVASRLTTEGSLVGTVHYIAPEQALGEEIDHRVDLYALGVMLYELTTGQLPFTADDPFAVITQHLHAPVVPPRAKNPEISVALDALIGQLLSKEAQDRPASAAQVRETLASLTAEQEAPALALETEEEFSVLDRITRGRLVGRERELRQARDLWRKAASGEGQVLLVTGEPGIGKTRLVRELTTQIEVSGGRALMGACYAEGGAPYAPFAQIVRRALDNGAGTDLDLPQFVLADLLVLSPALRLRFPDVPPNPSLDPQSEQQRLFENVVAFCAALGERTPLLLVLEDAHWADSGTLALLRHLARRLRRQQVLFVATYREVELDETRPLREMLLDLDRERLATRLKLSRLDREASRNLLASLFAEQITDEFLEGIYRETEGNPFFVEEVCKALVDSGDLYYQDGRWHRPSMEELQVPQSVRVAIQSRVRRLPAEVQDTLRLAAVLGRQFDFDTLARASEQDEDTLIDALERAEGVQLVEEISTDRGVTFAFAHALIPTTLVEEVRTLRRRRLHRRAAAAIEALRPDDLEALAYHCGEAGDEERALSYYTRAGERASAAYANQEAEGYFGAALDLVHSETEEAHLLSELGQVVARQGRLEEAIETWQAGIDLYRSLGDPAGIARLYARSARAVWYGGDLPRGLALCREGMEAIAGAPESAEVAALVHETARACHFNGLQEDASTLCRQALAMAERLDSVKVCADALATLGTIPGQPIKEVQSALTRAIEIAESAELLTQAARAHNNLAVCLGLQAGDLAAAREHFLRAAELERRMGNTVRSVFSACNAVGQALLQGDLATAEKEIPALYQQLEAVHDPGKARSLLEAMEARLLQFQGHVEEARECMTALQANARAEGDLQVLSSIDVALGDVLWETGQAGQAVAALREAIALGDRGLGYGAIVPRCVLSTQHAQLGELEMARDMLGQARKRAQEPGAGAFEAQYLLWAEAHLAVAEGRWSEAWSTFEALADGIGRAGSRWYRARVLREWAEAHLRCGEPGDLERARALFGEAKVEFEDMGALPYAAQIEEKLRDLEA
jgi:tetratricopeptide (TPR) repeat protein/predicted Ser/Thr protein kinase